MVRKRPAWVLLGLTVVFLAGCLIPNTYFDPFDPYARGLRWYDRGRPDLAAQYWDPLVEKGDCDAEYWIGLLHCRGQAKPQDCEKAMALWRKAAQGNHPKAQAALGDLFFQNESVTYHHCQGCTVEKDLGRAYFWYKLMERSARYDSEKKYAASVLKTVNAKLSENQKTLIDLELSQWKPAPKDCQPRRWW